MRIEIQDDEFHLIGTGDELYSTLLNSELKIDDKLESLGPTLSSVAEFKETLLAKKRELALLQEQIRILSEDE